MRISMCLAATLALAGWSYAQDPNNSNANRSSQTNTGTQGNTAAQTGSGASTQSASRSQSDNAKPAEMQTKKFKGTLVDASCAHGSGSAADRTSTGDTNNAAGTSNKKEKKAKTSGGDQAAAGCSVSSGTSQFALKMTDGNTVTFDSVGNQRAQQAIKDKKKWSEAASGGKPIRATVSGIMQGDKLLVVTIS